MYSVHSNYAHGCAGRKRWQCLFYLRTSLLKNEESEIRNWRRRGVLCRIMLRFRRFVVSTVSPNRRYFVQQNHKMAWNRTRSLHWMHVLITSLTHAIPNESISVCLNLRCHLCEPNQSQTKWINYSVNLWTMSSRQVNFVQIIDVLISKCIAIDWWWPRATSTHIAITLKKILKWVYHVSSPKMNRTRNVWW